MYFHQQLTENYGFEIDLFRKIVYSSEYSILFEVSLVPDRSQDHAPKFSIIFDFLKWKIFEIGIFNYNHLEDKSEDSECSEVSEAS